MEKEIWKDVVGYEGLYEVSSLGRVKSLARSIVRKNGWKQTFRERILSNSLDAYGYTQYSLSNCGVYKKAKGHRLVATAFISNPESLPQVNHKNGIKDENKVENLEWCDGSFNMSHAYRTGIRTVSRKQRLCQSKLSDIDVVEILKKYYSEENQGESQKTRKYTRRSLAVEYRVSDHTINGVLDGKSWKHIPRN